MKTRITILCENTVGVPLPVTGEYGFSAFIETTGGNYLFDTGQGFSIVNNARVLEKDLKGIKRIFISHGHFDHTGGLPGVLNITKEIEVFAHPDIFLERFYRLKTLQITIKRFVGLEYKRAYLEGLGAKFVLKREFYEVGEGVYLTGEVPRKTSFEKGDPNLVVLENEKFVPDKFLDDQSLAIDTERGLIVVLGCAHAGMINILNHFTQKTGKDSIYAVIGGTHLGFASADRLEETIKALRDHKIERIGVSHCTGMPASVRLAQEFKENFFFGNVGSVLEV
jgi:7,8-dihydropterin-6-yl-methyl-4-(beta-D-ribofuranosyl)aminobenzene 5'-phosphate synthase